MRALAPRRRGRRCSVSRRCFGFAPFGLSALPVFTLAGLFFLWRRARHPRTAAATGFAFGIGLFGVGVSWVYVALAQFGGMEGSLAALATVGFLRLPRALSRARRLG